MVECKTPSGWNHLAFLTIFNCREYPMAKYIVVSGIKIATDFVPETFGRLTTVGPMFMVKPRKQLVAMQVCACECGTVGVFLVNGVKRGSSQSCGCFRREFIKSRSITHGQCGTPEYLAWTNMFRRCYNPRNASFARYGGRGILVFSGWHGPEGFTKWLANVGIRPSTGHSINRIDNNGNYEPGNLEWSTLPEQANNKTTTRLLEYQGRIQSLTQWAEEIGMGQTTLDARLARGWDVEKALSTPIRKNKKK